jgi:hypothetical protein
MGESSVEKAASPQTVPTPQELREGIISALGEAPPWRKPEPPVKVGQIMADGYRLDEYVYVGGLGEKIPLSVAEPTVRMHGPAVLAIHQTNECGRREVFGLEGEPELNYGQGLARRGHRVFSIDLAWTGERSPVRRWDKPAFYERFPRWSMIGMGLADLRDLCTIASRDFGEPGPLNYVGHSLGGIFGYFLAGLYGGLNRLVCNAAYFQTSSPADPWNSQLYVSRVLQLHEHFCIAAHTDLLMSLAAMSSDTLLIHYLDDRIIELPTPSAGELIRMKQYSNRIHVVGIKGGHSFPHAVAEQSFRFLEGHEPEMEAMKE